MSRFSKIAIVAAAAVLMIGGGMAWTAHESNSGTGIAVVELFTSEGCSSCPPAEELLAKLVGEGRPRIYPLEFHVDYWDQAGWKDAYSDPRFSQRQEAYAKASGDRGVYTPQMIVNGGQGFVGSDAQLAAQAISSALKQVPAVAVSVRINPQSTHNQLVVDCTVDASASGKILAVALVERGIKRKIGNGENAGRVLRHENVVRSFENVSVAGTTTRVKLTIPDDAIPANCSVIAYVQDGAMRVLGASALDLASKPPGH